MIKRTTGFRLWSYLTYDEGKKLGYLTHFTSKTISDKEISPKHKGIMTAPLIGAITIEKYLREGQIEQVICGGENYDGARSCHYDWVKQLHDECVTANVTFAFIETGNYYVKDGKTQYINSKNQQAVIAYKENLQHSGKPINFKLTDRFGLPIPQDELYVPHYRTNCLNCGSRLICNGCSDCGKCD